MTMIRISPLPRSDIGGAGLLIPSVSGQGQRCTHPGLREKPSKNTSGTKNLFDRGARLVLVVAFCRLFDFTDLRAV